MIKLPWVKRSTLEAAKLYVCCNEVLDSGTHSHIDYRDNLAEVRKVVSALRGDNSAQFNRQKWAELDSLVGIVPSQADHQENIA